MFRHLVIAALAVLVIFFATQAFADDKAAQKPEGIIGTIMEVEGKATMTPAGTTAAKPLALKDHVHMNDVIMTAPKSRVLVLFIDNTQITMSENTRLKVDSYIFDPGNSKNNKASYNILQGTFQYLSGLIAKKKDPDVNIETAYGTIGIRGTKLWAGALKDAYGVHVQEGAVQVKNDGGQVLVKKGQGTTLKSRTAAPPPAFPFSQDQMQFIAQTVLLANAEEVFARIAGFQDQQILLQGQFQNFLKFNGMPGIPGGGNLPIPGGGNLQLPGGGNLQFPGGGNNQNGKDGKNDNGRNKKGKSGGGGFPGAPAIPGGFPF